MNRVFKAVSLFLVLALCAVSLCACGGSDKETLTVFIPYDYIDESLLDEFKKESGVDVKLAFFTTIEEMYTKYAASPSDYDILIPSDYMIERLISENLICEIDTSKLANYSGLYDWIKTPAYDPEGKYSVAYMWGTVGLLYNTTMVDEGDCDSWGILFDKKYAGNIIMLNSVRETMGLALKYLGFSMSTFEKSEINAARDLLIKQKQDGIVKAYLVDETKDMMAADEAAIAVMWSGDALYAMDKNENLAYSIPKEGSNIWIDAMCIASESKHKDAAYKFIDFFCQKDNAYKNQQYIYYSSPVKAVVDEMYTDEERANPALNPSQETIDNCEFYHDILPANDLYESAWMEVKQAH